MSYFSFFFAPFNAPNDGMALPYTLPAQRTSSLTSKFLQKPTLGKLMHLSMKGRPPKARARNTSLFFDGSLSSALNKGTSCGKC
jgi:hypothetical protein